MDTSTLSGFERRRSPRLQPAKSEARVICQRGELFLGPNLAVSLVDASEEGLGFMARESLGAGERISLSLDGIGLPRAVERLARVAWCEPAEGGLFRVGVELDTPLQYAELMSLCTP